MLALFTLTLSSFEANKLVAGPIASGFIAENTTWRWIFYATSILGFLIQILGLFLLRETYPPKILANKTTRLIHETGNQNLYHEYEDPDKTIGKILRISLVRPFKLLGTQVIIQVLAVYMAYLYGLMYLVLSTFPTLWEKDYHMSIGIGGLNYLSLGIGFFLGVQICAPLSDKVSPTHFSLRTKYHSTNPSRYTSA